MAERIQNMSHVVGIRQCLMPSSYLDHRAILEMKSASVDNKQLGKNNSLLDTVLQITMDDVKKQTAAAKEMCLGLELEALSQSVSIFQFRDLSQSGGLGGLTS